MTENTTPEAQTDEDLAAIAASLAHDEDGPVMTNTVLRVWREMLSHLEAASVEPISSAFVVRILSAWPRLELSEIKAYWDFYYASAIKLRDLMEDAIATDPDSVERVEDDGTVNREVYLEVMYLWSRQFEEWEREWDYSAPHALAETFATADIFEFFLGRQGLVAYLYQEYIGFEWGEEDQTALVERVTASFVDPEEA